jgi:hypothetical protein
VLEDGSISSKMDGVEGASDLVRCVDVRSCAIDYAIRRGWMYIVVAMMEFEEVEGYKKSALRKVIQTQVTVWIDGTLKATLPSACSAYRLAYGSPDRAVENCRE